MPRSDHTELRANGHHLMDWSRREHVWRCGAAVGCVPDRGLAALIVAAVALCGYSSSGGSSPGANSAASGAGQTPAASAVSSTAAGTATTLSELPVVCQLIEDVAAGVTAAGPLLLAAADYGNPQVLAKAALRRWPRGRGVPLGSRAAERSSLRCGRYGIGPHDIGQRPQREQRGQALQIELGDG